MKVASAAQSPGFAAVVAVVGTATLPPSFAPLTTGLPVIVGDTSVLFDIDTVFVVVTIGAPFALTSVPFKFNAEKALTVGCRFHAEITESAFSVLLTITTSELPFG